MFKTQKVKKMVSTLEQMQVQNGIGPGVQRSKRPLLDVHRTPYTVSWDLRVAFVCTHDQIHIFVLPLRVVWVTYDSLNSCVHPIAFVYDSGAIV